MPDQISRVDFYIGTIPHKMGEGIKILSALKDAGVNLTGFLGYRKTARLAEIVIVVAEGTPSPSRMAKKAGLELGPKQKGLLVNGEDRLGAVADVMAKLAEAQINVESLHAVVAGENRYGALISIEAASLRKAAKALGL